MKSGCIFSFVLLFIVPEASCSHRLYQKKAMQNEFTSDKKLVQVYDSLMQHRKDNELINKNFEDGLLHKIEKSSCPVEVMALPNGKMISFGTSNNEEYSFNGKSISAMQYLVKKLMKENQGKVPTTLTYEQKKEYFKAVYAFQDYHTKVECNCAYATPLDYNIDLPKAAFEVINKMRENSNCNK